MKRKTKNKLPDGVTPFISVIKTAANGVHKAANGINGYLKDSEKRKDERELNELKSLRREAEKERLKAKIRQSKAIAKESKETTKDYGYYMRW